MDIKDLANVSTVVINSLLMLLKDNHVVLESVVMQLSNNNNEALSPEVNLGELTQQTLDELQKAKASVPEGFVLVPRIITDEWMEVYVDQVITKYCMDYEDTPHYVRENELPELREDQRLPIRRAHERLMQVIEAQEPSNDS